LAGSSNPRAGAPTPINAADITKATTAPRSLMTTHDDDAGADAGGADGAGGVVCPARALNRKYGRRHLMKTRAWGPNQAARSIPRGACDRGAATQLVPTHRVTTSLWIPRAQVTPYPVSCAPRQRALGSNRGAARPPRAPPGRSESQLEPPDSWAPASGGARGCPLNRVP
jgi:hypothetical protein